jgi:hypothetical protein
MPRDDAGELSSAGHALGQYVGDWWEKRVVYPLLLDVSKRLWLFLDNRIVDRGCRAGKIQWPDADGNSVDYDFVLELNGRNDSYGTPVAFVESFWRRGARHSKDKARDDTNKLLPMRDTYPTARFLAIAACGEFTEPARTYVTSRLVELLYVPKANIIRAFADVNIVIDYPDNLTEESKLQLVKNLQRRSNEKIEIAAAKALVDGTGKSNFKSFEKKVEAALSALPLEISFKEAKYSETVTFNSVDEATQFLESPKFSYDNSHKSFVYQVVYSDGYKFEREGLGWGNLKTLHHELLTLVRHVSKLNE